jgi:ABC-type nitrate/sulfonate/bicarbonate transport system substrate-binding protein
VLEPYSLSADTVKIVNIGTMDVLAAFKRHIDFAWIFYGWDGIRAEIDNITLTYLPLIEIDSRLDYYTPMFITSERMIAEEADTVRRFLRAVSRSYAEVITNPAAAARILVSQVTEIDSELARRSLEYLEPYFQADADYWGKMDLAVWQRFSTFLQDLLPRPLDARKAFTNRFLPQNTP